MYSYILLDYFYVNFNSYLDYNFIVMKFVIFDLDGTLINTLKGITVAVNKFLKFKNINKKYSEDEVKKFIGNGAELLFKRFMNGYEYNTNDYELFIKYYKDNQIYSEVYNNVDKTLKELKKRGYLTYILSNKPDELLKILIPSLFKDIDFDYIQGQDKNYKCKPDVTLLNERIINKYNLNSNDGFYVGDSYVDIQTGKNAKLKTIFVTYGYGDKNVALMNKPDYVIEDFSELLGILK